MSEDRIEVALKSLFTYAAKGTEDDRSQQAKWVAAMAYGAKVGYDENWVAYYT